MHSFCNGCQPFLAAASGDPNPGALQKTRVLFLTGGCCHDWDGVAPILEDILRSSGDFEVTLTQDRDYLTAPEVNRFDVLLFYTQGGDITPAQREGLLGFVKKGGGLVGLHGATASFKTSDEYWELVGGRFTTHTHKVFEVFCADPSHPITAGFAPFKIYDEDYNHNFKDKNIHVLAKRDGDVPVMWTRDYGKGRVFINALGHDAGVFNNRTFQTVTVRGLYWAARRNPKPLPKPKPIAKTDLSAKK